MTGLFLSECASRRDGWCINTCLGKLFGTRSPELGLLKLDQFFKDGYNLYRAVHLYRTSILASCGVEQVQEKPRASTVGHTCKTASGH